ncbi:hypothetical protein LTR64_006690 [Lithohypha guttulata]|uniref:Uncharacterized protein n=1 Tax=Lithohypha guttulata TaxID=1690604 RepID=A0AAN7T6R1_9EURO|nr:hypothetical protein LTR51_004750 [Lithohypha guttulata]KAK5091358.1 hypothetical protein LTR05_001541 [Lithohypha guttulata]
MGIRLERRQPPPGTRPQEPEDDSPDTNSGPNAQTIAIIIIVALSILITAITALYIYLRRRKLKNRGAPNFIPGFLRQRWDQWHPVGKYASVNLQERGDRHGSTSQATEYHGAAGSNNPNTATTAGVDRNTSVRSVMTLPPYSQAPKETEQVIGREGERGGMDTVVEFPETAEEEETTRDAEMETLYQIREARRREIAEREERRRERREARERGDWARLEELRRESQRRNQPAQNGSTGNLTADVLIAEHQSRPKDRRVSSVAYGDVGQVRHDGTRVRANSHESERRGLLSGAAPMGENVHGRTGSDVTSLLTLDNISRPSLTYVSGRQRSDSGVTSISTVSSIDLPQPTPTTTGEAGGRMSNESDQQASTSDDSPGATRLTPDETEDGSEGLDPRIIAMIRDSDNDVIHPPDYDLHDWGDAPDYEEAVRRRESQRSARLAVPTINIESASEPASPALSRVSEEHARGR